MWVQSLSQEDPLEDGTATHSSIPAWRIPMDRGAWRATVHTGTKSQTQLKQPSLQASGYSYIKFYLDNIVYRSFQYLNFYPFILLIYLV